jgi:predicted nucleic acid-binding protein
VIYFDTSYLVRIYFEDRGFEVVRELASTDHVSCASHGQAEVISAFHRKFRERTISLKAYRALLAQFDSDNRAEGIRWLPLGSDVLAKIREIYRTLPADIYLRGADALHLATASVHRHRTVYSNDTHLLAAASHFEMLGENVIPPAR